MVRLAIVGLADYGFSLAKNIEQLSSRARCRLVAAADMQIDKLDEPRAWLKEHDVEIFSDALTMFEKLKGRCDAVYIATGIGTHATLANAALRAGFPVHLEKPPAAVVQDVDSIQATLARTGLFCLVGFQAVHGQEMRQVKQRIVAGRLGEIRAVVCRGLCLRGADYYSRNDWAGRLRSGNNWVLDGPATNALAHQVTNCLLLASRREFLATPTAVRAELYVAGERDSHDIAAMEVLTAEGVTIHFYVTHRCQGLWGPVIDVIGDKGSARCQPGKGSVITLADGSSETIPGNADARNRMIETFVKAVASGDASELLCPLAEARKMVLFLDGAHESSRSIHRIGPQYCRLVDPGPKQNVVVSDIDTILHSAAEARVLPSQLSPAPEWAVKTTRFDLAGYDNFPRHFKA